MIRMGSFMAKQTKRIMIVGWDGKTSLAYKLKLGDIMDEAMVETIRSKGAISDGVTYKNINFL